MDAEAADDEAELFDDVVLDEVEPPPPPVPEPVELELEPHARTRTTATEERPSARSKLLMARAYRVETSGGDDLARALDGGLARRGTAHARALDRDDLEQLGLRGLAA